MCVGSVIFIFLTSFLAICNKLTCLFFIILGTNHQESFWKAKARARGDWQGTV
jgi:hypothetical protein